MTENVTEISIKEMDALIERMESNLKDGLSPEPDDVRLILQVLKQFTLMQQKLENNSYMKERYLKLMGLVSSSESQASLQGKGRKSSPRKRKKKSDSDLPPPKVCHHKLEGLEKGQTCPDCEQGKVYKTEPASFIRITGQAPLSVEKHIMEQLRCNLCGNLFTASLPEDVSKDGVRQQKYGYSARSIMAISKFYMGNPYYRQENLQSFLNVPVTASTIYDQCALLADDALPVFDYLKHYAANANHFNIDDTTNRILTETSVEKPNRNSKGTRQRTGIYTSCLLASHDDKTEVALFKTNIGHSGEWIDEIFSMRHPEKALPLVMSDALPSNKPKALPSEISLCNAHSRRKFVDVINNYPDEVNYVISSYGQIWDNNTQTETEGMNKTARLAYHQAHSLPVMKALKQWCKDKLNEKSVEENSGLGKAINYFLTHYHGLTAFCRIEGASLDNNAAERVVKLIVRGRKNALFYKTLSGAQVGDVITSLIATCELNGVNSFEYLTAIQRNRLEAGRQPEKWLPWTYLTNLETSEEAAA